MRHLILPLIFAIASFSDLLHAHNDTETALFKLPPGTNVTTIHILDDHGERNIAYYESNGFAIVDGDIAYGTVAELLARVIPVDNDTIASHHSLDSRAHSIFPNGPKWPNANVIYKYDSDITEINVHKYIDEGIRRWQVKNPFLQFTKVSPPSASPMAGVVTITAQECGGCYASVVGYSSFDNLVVNLQQSCNGVKVGCFEAEATHELGHVLGLVHEVKRPDRGQHVKFNCKNLVDYTPACCTSKCCGLACQFSMDNTFDHDGPYSVKSIMHYRADAFARDSLLTLEGIAPDVVPLFNAPFPDDLDNERICEIYKGKCGNVCGNGVVEPGEECDDGNLIDHDGCSSACKKEPLCTSCNPIPGLNKCDVTTSCINTLPSGKHHCACRAGFKANALDSQIALHYRLSFPGQEYRVFVAPGVACDTLCDNPFGAPQDICNEVPVVSQCN